MFRHLTAASAVVLMLTGSALAQTTEGVDRAPEIDAIQPDVDRLRADYDARFADYDERMMDYDMRLTDMERRLQMLEERGVERAGSEMGEDIVDANQPEQDVIE